jgi:alcohol dehydrogenase, propanol-preferring
MRAARMRGYKQPLIFEDLKAPEISPDEVLVRVEAGMCPNLAVGAQVVVVGVWGDGSCRQCQVGDTQICAHGVWPGFSAYGGYGELVPVPHNYLIRVDRKYGLKADEFAPLTDAGLTP